MARSTIAERYKSPIRKIGAACMLLMILSGIVYYFQGVMTIQPLTWGLGLLSYAFIIADDIRRGDWFGAGFLGIVGVWIFFLIGLPHG